MITNQYSYLCGGGNYKNQKSLNTMFQRRSGNVRKEGRLEVACARAGGREGVTMSHFEHARNSSGSLRRGAGTRNMCIGLSSASPPPRLSALKLGVVWGAEWRWRRARSKEHYRLKYKNIGSLHVLCYSDPVEKRDTQVKLERDSVTEISRVTAQERRYKFALAWEKLLLWLTSEIDVTSVHAPAWERHLFCILTWGRDDIGVF